jgi:prepilin-type N-terminal cleavage/methylation domain-containing protein
LLRPPAGAPGLTLVEVLISIAILALGAGLVMQALARGAHTLVVARNRSTAYAFSAAKMTDLESLNGAVCQYDTAEQFRAGNQRCQ